METLQPTGVHFRLLVLGDGTVRSVPLHGARWTIGRSTDCSVLLRDPTVSRRHLLIERLPGDEFRFQDLGGSNPVLLDGKPLKAGVVGIGQTLSIGLTRLVLERREGSAPVTTSRNSTVVISREVADEDAAREPAPHSVTAAATRVLDRIEWTFADLGDLTHAAEPLLDLALNLTDRKRGLLGRFSTHGGLEPLAVRTPDHEAGGIHLPEAVLADARRIQRPHLVTTQEGDATQRRLVIPLGNGPDGLLVLEGAGPEAADGQELLHLASSLSKVIWHRLQETTERLRLRDELQRLRFHGSSTHNALLASPRLQDARQALRAAASAEQPVLLHGEDGTEIEALARYLHAESPRRAGPFVSWDAERCPADLHERELFGDGDRHPGALQRAQGGTLFLDHCDQVAPELCERLLALVHAPERGTALVVSARRPPDAGPAANAICGFLPHQMVHVPPLRGHARDVLALSELILSELGTAPDGSPRLLTERSKRQLAAYSWPGNVRELRLVLEAAAAEAAGQPIAPRHLPPAIAADAEQAGAPPMPTLEDVERLHIVEVMERTGGNRTRAAQLLGIATSTLYEKLKKYRIGTGA